LPCIGEECFGFISPWLNNWLSYVGEECFLFDAEPCMSYHVWFLFHPLCLITSSFICRWDAEPCMISIWWTDRAQNINASESNFNWWSWLDFEHHNSRRVRLSRRECWIQLPELNPTCACKFCMIFTRKMKMTWWCSNSIMVIILLMFIMAFGLLVWDWSTKKKPMKWLYCRGCGIACFG